jgi:hypothetical protein
VTGIPVNESFEMVGVCLRLNSKLESCFCSFFFIAWERGDLPVLDAIHSCLFELRGCALCPHCVAMLSDIGSWIDLQRCTRTVRR